MKYLIDSNIIIYHLNGDNRITSFLRENITYCAISIITYIEVLSFDFSNSQEKDNVRKLLKSFRIYDTTEDIAEIAISNRQRKKIRVPDNIIASTAKVYNLCLVTRNISDFNNLDLDIFEI